MNLRKLLTRYFLPGLVTALSLTLSCTAPTGSTENVKSVIDRVVTRLYAEADSETLRQIGYENVFTLFTESELQTLSSTHWMFDANVPVVVYVMRSIKQQETPFWLLPAGFEKTSRTLSNEQTTYEVWQKRFEKGRIGLGVNGFENYGLHYFVAVIPANPGDDLILSNFFPANQYVGTLRNGAFTYHDWTELVLFDVPSDLEGAQLLTTVRGRGVESHLINAFRTTDYPSSSLPDQVLLTWSSDPSTSVDIQFRTAADSEGHIVRYRKQGTDFIFSAETEVYLMEDRLLMNDRFINRHTATITGLEPGASYDYLISPSDDWDKAYTFTTAADDNTFSFLGFSDVHNSSFYGELVKLAAGNHPEAAFQVIAGDQVNDGLYRNHWDELFAYTEFLNHRIPMMTVPGNHDNRAGLGARMFQEMFSYPGNGPDGVPAEQTYAFQYKNALFLMLDATSPLLAQTEWIERQLSNTNADWKIVVTHFPPYNFSSPYLNIQRAWIPVFDKYNVDLVLSGHIHYYMRSNPMKGGEVVTTPGEGTIYAVSVAQPARDRDIGEEPYAAVRNSTGHLYQHIRINGDKLEYSAIDIQNKIVDQFTLRK